VPALVSESTFALAQEQLERNKHHSPRRTVEPSLLQGMLVCEKCGYTLYRSSAQTSTRKLYYYRCLGSDAHRYRNGAVCDNRPIRQDYLDSFVWTEILRLLDDPTLIQAELDRRMEAAKLLNIALGRCHSRIQNIRAASSNSSATASHRPKVNRTSFFCSGGAFLRTNSRSDLTVASTAAKPIISAAANSTPCARY